MIKELLTLEEGKCLEFKENASSLKPILQTVCAFANTAGGHLVIGVRDKTKEVIGLENVLDEELRLSNTIANSIVPLLMPDIHVVSWQGKELLIIQVPHSPGPCFLQSVGLEKGTFVRVGSTTRVADANAIAELQRLRANISFDELPAIGCRIEDVDLEQARKLFDKVGKTFTDSIAMSLKLLQVSNSISIPTNAAIILFGDRKKAELFSDAIVKCVRFKGESREEALDHLDVEGHLPALLEPTLAFIRRNTSMRSVIGETVRSDFSEYPPVVLREAIINALVHANYDAKGSSTTVAIFDDRIEITNPGTLPFGLTLTDALRGMSHLRNRVIGRVFKELNLIDQWGSGFLRMVEVSKKAGLAAPQFEELGNFFRVTLFNKRDSVPELLDWQIVLINHIKTSGQITPKDAEQLWRVSDRASRTRLKKMVDDGLISPIGSSHFDPQKVYVLK